MSVVSYQMNAQSGGYSTQEPIAVPRTSLTETSSPCFSMSMVPEFNNKHVIEDRECYKNALENCSSSNLYPSSLPFSVSGTHIGWEHEISNPHKLQSFSTEEKMLPLQIEPVVTQTSSHFLETGEAWQQVLDHNRRFPSQVNPILPASMGNMAQTVEHALANGASLGNFMARQTICENQSGLYRPFGPGMDKMSNLKCSWNSTQSLELVDPSKSALVCQQRVAMINHTNPDLGFSLTSENGASLSDDRFHLIRGIRDPLNLQGTWHGDRLLTTSGCAPLESTIQIIEDGDRLSKGPSDFSFSHGGCVVAPASMVDENSALFTKMDNGIPTGNGLTNSESQDVDPEDSLSFGQIAREQGNSLSKRIKRKDISPEKQNEGPYASTPNFLREQKDLESEEGQAKRFKGAEATKDKDELRCKGEKSSSDNSGNSSPGNARDNRPPEPPKPDYIHVRARRGQATDSHSLAERVRREKISERMKFLQDLVPGCNKVTGKAVMLDEIINYVQSLQRQVEFLSMKLAAVNPKLDFNMDSFLLKEMLQSRGSASNLVSGAISANKYQPHKTLLQASMPHGVDLRSVVSMTEGTERRRSCPPSAVSAHNETAATVPTAWEGELQSIVQMGIGQNRSLPSLADSLPCHLPNINMKAEL